MSQAEKMPKVAVDDEGILACPICGDIYLHQEEVESGWRKEDDDVYRHISRQSGVHMDVVSAKNVNSPGGYGYRRDYIIVRFSCEGCSHRGIELCIRQHKGLTVLTWVNLGSAPIDAEGDSNE